MPKSKTLTEKIQNVLRQSRNELACANEQAAESSEKLAEAFLYYFKWDAPKLIKAELLIKYYESLISKLTSEEREVIGLLEIERDYFRNNVLSHKTLGQGNSYQAILDLEEENVKRQMYHKYSNIIEYLTKES